MLENLQIDYSWSFTEKTIKDTSYITHSYYTYPAKFIPQLAQRLICENSEKGDIIIDPFCGSGTTIVEGIINNRISIGVDINEIASLVAKVKSTPINPKIISEEFTKLTLELNTLYNGQLDNYFDHLKERIASNERINFWFKPHIKDKLSFLLIRILKTQDSDIKNFFLVAFSQILKTSSISMQKSVKPTRDINKKDYDPVLLFIEQLKKMIRKNNEFYQLLDNEVKKNIDSFRYIYCDDARHLQIENETASLIVTTPPYVTSYEYADLHQLPLLWLGYLDELSSYRKKFIGSSYRERGASELKSTIADQIVNNLGNNKKGREVRNYFADMLDTWIEAQRVLKKVAKYALLLEILNIKVLIY